MSHVLVMLSSQSLLNHSISITYPISILSMGYPAPKTTDMFPHSITNKNPGIGTFFQTAPTPGNLFVHFPPILFLFSYP